MRFVFFFFALRSFCLAFSSETMCTRALSINFIRTVVMVTAHEEVTAILGQAVVSGNRHQEIYVLKFLPDVKNPNSRSIALSFPFA